MRHAPFLLWAVACVAPTSPSTTTSEGLDAIDIPAAPPSVEHDVTVAADGSFAPPLVEVWPGDIVVWHFPDAAGAVVEVLDGAEPCSTVAPAAPYGLTGPEPFAPGGLFVAGATPLDAARGVALTLRWSELEPRPGVFDWTALDAAVTELVSAGRLYAVGVVAGDATPAWLPEVGVELLTFGGPGEECPPVVEMGDPTDAAWQARWFGVTAAVAEHLRGRADWWRSLAYVTLGGANVVDRAAELPRGCSAGCGCDPEVWASHGYDAAGLVSFYERSLDQSAEVFPGKATVFPRVAGGFPSLDGIDPTPDILAAGRSRGWSFVPLEVGVAAGSELDPALVRLADGFLGTEVVDGSDDGLQRSFAAGASLVELPLAAAVVWGEAPGPLSGRTLAEWDTALAERRAERAELPEPLGVHRWTVVGTAGETLSFATPTACDVVGQLLVR